MTPSSGILLILNTVSYWFRLPLDVRDGTGRAHSYIVLVSCFTDACKRNGVPVPVVHPCPLHVKACIFKKKPDGLVLSGKRSFATHGLAS